MHRGSLAAETNDAIFIATGPLSFFCCLAGHREEYRPPRILTVQLTKAGCYTHVLRVDGFELGVKPESRGYRFVETRVVAKIPRVHKPFALLRATPVEVVHDNSGTDHDKGKLGDGAKQFG